MRVRLEVRDGRGKLIETKGPFENGSLEHRQAFGGLLGLCDRHNRSRVLGDASRLLVHTIQVAEK